MKVRFIRQRSLPAVGSSGPFTRIFEVGQVLDLPEIHARTFIAQGDAVVDSGRPAPAPKPEIDDEAPDPAPAPKKAKPAARKTSK